MAAPERAKFVGPARSATVGVRRIGIGVGSLVKRAYAMEPAGRVARTGHKSCRAGALARPADGVPSYLLAIPRLTFLQIRRARRPFGTVFAGLNSEGAVRMATLPPQAKPLSVPADRAADRPVATSDARPGSPDNGRQGCRR